METALVIMAAGIGSRFGGGIKQLASVGPSGEIIMDYSIFDAIEAGFDRIVFIIRHDLEADFREVIGERLERRFPGRISYAYQEGDDLPKGFTKPADRVKPWGTGHAVLACREMLQIPALVINADDYYGKAVYAQMHEWLISSAEGADNGLLRLAMPGFVLENTLSENGGVTRGLCRVDENGYLSEIVETRNICCDPNGSAYVETENGRRMLERGTAVSMNMWGFTPALLPVLEAEFRTFLAEGATEDPKSEFLLPTVIGKLVSEKRAQVRVIPCSDRWFGVTYKEDRESVAENIRALVRDGAYRSPLF